MHLYLNLPRRGGRRLSRDYAAGLQAVGALERVCGLTLQPWQKSIIARILSQPGAG